MVCTYLDIHGMYLNLGHLNELKYPWIRCTYMHEQEVSGVFKMEYSDFESEHLKKS